MMGSGPRASDWIHDPRDGGDSAIYDKEKDDRGLPPRGPGDRRGGGGVRVSNEDLRERLRGRGHDRDRSNDRNSDRDRDRVNDTEREGEEASGERRDVRIVRNPREESERGATGSGVSGSGASGSGFRDSREGS
ncbi:hypothetical protein CLOM_g22538, partial [Closterium sp. NIES-68]